MGKDMSNSMNILKEGCHELGIELGNDMQDRFLLFYELLTERNKVMNLTAVTEPEDVAVKHFLDSLSIVRAIDLTEYESLIDVGTGPGFPGIPLKIVFPQLRITLMDALNKRVSFLKDVIEQCGLEDIEAVHARAEDLGRDENYREKFDLCVSRAVAPLSPLSEYCIPFVRTGGSFVAYKGGDITDEVRASLNAVNILAGEEDPSIVSFSLPGGYERSLIVTEKKRATPGKYPRSAAAVKKKPL